MSTETNTDTVTVEMSVESAYAQLVGFQQASLDYEKAEAADDHEAQMQAASDAVDACIGLINEIMPPDLSQALHARLEEEHPDLVPQEDPMMALLRELLNGNVPEGL